MGDFILWVDSSRRRGTENSSTLWVQHPPPQQNSPLCLHPSLSPGAPLTWEGPQLSVLLFCCEENNFCCGRRVQNCSLTPVPSSCWHAQYPQVALPLLPRTKVTLGLADQGLAAAAQGSTGHGTSLVITDAMKPLLPSNFGVIRCCP